MLDPRNHRSDEVDTEQRNEREEQPDAPFVDGERRKENNVTTHPPEQSAAVGLIAARFEIQVRLDSENSPGVPRKIAKEIEAAGAVVVCVETIVLEAAVFAMVQPDMDGAIKLGNISVKIPKEEFDVAAKDFTVNAREITLGAVSFEVFDAEYPDEALKPDAVERKVEKRLQAEGLAFSGRAAPRRSAAR